jgi:hypothetical protein
LHFDGTSWSIVPTGVTHSLYGIWAASPTAIWAVGGQGAPETAQGIILFSDGGDFTVVDDDFPGTLRAIHGTGPNDIWAVGQRVRLHHDGTAWTVDPAAPDFNVASVWAGATDSAFVVGENGRTQRFDGTAWLDVPTGLGPVGLSAVGGVGRDDVLALGSNGTMLSFDGTSWTSIGSYGDVTLLSLWVYDVKTAWAAGSSGGVTRFTTDSFFEVDSGTDQFLLGIHGSSPQNVWVVGWGKTVLKLRN